MATKAGFGFIKYSLSKANRTLLLFFVAVVADFIKEVIVLVAIENKKKCSIFKRTLLLHIKLSMTKMTKK